MICKKRIKRCIARSMGLVIGLMFSMNAMAASKVDVTFIDGVKVHMSSSAMYGSGVGTTASANYDLTVTAKVSGTYKYVNIDTGEDFDVVLQQNVGASSASISCGAPKKCKTVSIGCDHEAIHNDQVISGHTSAVY